MLSKDDCLRCNCPSGNHVLKIYRQVPLSPHTERKAGCSAMRLELLNKGNHMIGASCKKAGLTAIGKHTWRGKFDRRKSPRDEDCLIEIGPPPAGKHNDQR